MQTMSATDLARNTREILNLVSGRGETVVIERNRVPIARIAPPERRMTAAQMLDGLRPMPESGDAATWLTDSRDGFDDGIRNPWV
jgi:antitoxin (DNA-binding transcriptional repressor) of toxin-antitoxin stability system